MKLKNFAIITLILFTLNILAQNKVTEKGNEAFEKGYWNAAIENYKLALKKEKDNELKMLITYRTAIAYEKSRDYANAINWYLKVIKKGGAFLDKNPEAFLNIANSYKALENFELAIDNYKTYNIASPNDPRGINGQKSAELALKWIDEPTRHIIENFKDVNTKFDDAAPIFAGRKYDEIMFVSYREGSEGKEENFVSGQPFPDFYYTKQDKAKTWSKAAGVEGEVNTEFAEGKGAFDNRKTTFYFTRCKHDKKVITGCDIMYAKRQGKAFAEAVKLELFKGDTTFKVMVHPELSIDDQKLFFSANHKDGFGGYDLYYVEWDKKAKDWGKPVNLGAEINTPGDEFYPSIHEDGSLYFSSNGHIGIGGFDLFKVEKTDKGFGPVTNLKFPLNSSSDDIAIIFEGKDEKGYITSNRAGGKGKMDIWSFVLPPLELYLEGVICNQKVPGEVVANAKVKLEGSDGSVKDTISDQFGKYKFALLPNTTYKVSAISEDKIKNQFGTDVLKFFRLENPFLVDVIGVKESKTFTQDICLDPIPQEGIRLPKILYELNKSTLLPESKERLKVLVKILNDNPTLIIEMGSHTDFRGSVVYNEKLSRDRAESAVNFLIEQGIDKERLSFQGYGKREPYKLDEKSMADIPAEYKSILTVGTVLSEEFIKGLKDNKFVEECHQLNRRTEFKVLRTDYVPKSK